MIIVQQGGITFLGKAARVPGIFVQECGTNKEILREGERDCYDIRQRVGESRWAIVEERRFSAVLRFLHIRYRDLFGARERDVLGEVRDLLGKQRV
jgi:hypothetical protein